MGGVSKREGRWEELVRGGEVGGVGEGEGRREEKNKQQMSSGQKNKHYSTCQGWLWVSHDPCGCHVIPYYCMCYKNESRATALWAANGPQA